MLQLNTHVPDRNVNEVITNMSNFLPTKNGYSVSQTYFESFNFALPSVFEVYTANFLNGTSEVYAVTPTAIYQVVDNELVLPTVISSCSTASFAVLGNVVLFANGVDKVMFKLVGDEEFTEIEEAPIVKFITVSLGMVLGFNDLVQGNNWYSSTIADYTDWIPSVSNTASFGSLQDVEGAITACIAYRDDVLVFTASSVHLGRYVDNDLKWTWTVVDKEIGSITKPVETSLGVVFKDANAIYYYNTSTIKEVGLEIKELLDSSSSLLYVHPWVYCTTGTNTLLAFSLEQLRWGIITTPTTPRVYFTYSRNGLTIAGLDTLYTTIGAIPDELKFDSGVMEDSPKLLGYIDTNNNVYGITTGSKNATAYIHFYGYGSDTTQSMLSKVKVGFIELEGVTVKLQLQYKDKWYSPWKTHRDADLFKGVFNIRKASNYYRGILKVEYNSSSLCEVADIDYVLDINKEVKHA